MPSLTSAPFLTRRTAVRLSCGGLAAAVGASGRRSADAHDLTVLDANKALVHRLFDEALNDGNAAIIHDLYAPGFVDRGTGARQMPGPAGMPLTIDQFHTAFPDVVATVEVAVAEDSMVAIVATWHGTHPPAGTHLMGRTMHVFHIANEQIVEEWSAGWEWLDQRDDSLGPRPRHPLAEI